MPEKTIADYKYHEYLNKKGGFERNLFEEVKKLRKEVDELKK